MYRSVLTSLVVASLALIAAPTDAQQPSPATGTMARAQPVGVVQQQDCPKLIYQINRATAVRFDPAAADARQVAAGAERLQAEGRYAECFSTAEVPRDRLIASTTAPVYPEIYDPREWAHPNESARWVRRLQAP
jgi:hypothetical protein